MTGSRGGKRQGAGRKRGAVGALTINIRALARLHTDAAISALVEVVNDAVSPQRVMAAGILLDRGYGKPKGGKVDITHIMAKLKAGEATAKDTAIDIEALQVPLPEIVKILVAYELDNYADTSRCMATEEEMNKIYAEAIESAKHGKKMVMARIAEMPDYKPQ